MIDPTLSPRIFVSHSHEDNLFGVQLAQDLRRELGDDEAVWYDASGGLHGGDSWWDVIVKELVARSVLILIISPASMKSDWVRREFLLALTKGKRIIPVLYRSGDIWDDLKLLQFISFLPPKEYVESFRELVAALNHPIAVAAPAPVVRARATTARCQRLKQELMALQTHYDFLVKKIATLRGDLLAQAPGALREQLGSDVAREEKERLKLEAHMEDVERKIEAECG